MSIAERPTLQMPGGSSPPFLLCSEHLAGKIDIPNVMHAEGVEHARANGDRPYLAPLSVEWLRREGAKSTVLISPEGNALVPLAGFYLKEQVEQGDRCFQLGGVFVREELRRCGVMLALLGEAMLGLREQHGPGTSFALKLLRGPDGRANPKALSLYRRLGLREVGASFAEVDGVRLPAVAMQSSANWPDAVRTALFSKREAV